MSEEIPAYGKTCPESGDRHQIVVECFAGNRARTCDLPHPLSHTHYACTKCMHEWVEDRSTH
jgi:hypothetical protein